MFTYKLTGLTTANRRKDRRTPLALPGTANEKSVLIMDVSLGGLIFRGDRLQFRLGDEILVEMDVPPLGDVAIGANVVRVADQNEYGAAFMGLSSDAFELIEAVEFGRHRRPLRQVA